MISPNNIFSFFVVALPILNAYGFFGGLSIGMIMVALSMLLICVKNNNYRLFLPKYYNSFFFYICIISVVISIFTRYFDFSGVLRTSFKIIGFIITLGFVFKYLNKEKAIYYYKKIILISIIFFFLQEILFYSTGHRISGLIPFLPLIYENIDTQSLISTQIASLRSSSFFLEPSYFAQYLIPYLIITIFEKSNDNKKKIIKIILVIIVLILLQSGTGIMLLMAALLFSLFFLLKNISALKKILLIASICIIVPLSIAYVASTTIGQQLLMRTSELNPDSEDITSGFMRFNRGFYVYNELSPLNKIVGVGQGNLRLLIEHRLPTNIRALFFNEIYVNMIQQILITSGVIGLILFLYCHLKFYITSETMGKIILFALFILMFMDAIYCTPIMLLYMAFASNKNETYPEENANMV